MNPTENSPRRNLLEKAMLEMIALMKTQRDTVRQLAWLCNMQPEMENAAIRAITDSVKWSAEQWRDVLVNEFISLRKKEQK